MRVYRPGTVRSIGKAASSWLPVIAPWCLALILAGGLALIPPAYFLFHLETDSLIYYAMARHIAETGWPYVSHAANLPTVIYASGVSYLYAPAMAVFESYEARIRAIQFINVVLIGITFAMAIRYFRIALSGLNLTVLSVAFGLAIAVDAIWQQSAMKPNSDLLTSVITLAAMLVAADDRRGRLEKSGILLLFGSIGFFVKISLAMIPVAFALTEFLARTPKTPRERAALATCLGAGLLMLLLNSNLTFHYFWSMLVDPASPYLSVSPSVARLNALTSVVNFWFSALPGTIIPNLRYMFVDNPAYNTLAFSLQPLTLRLLAGLLAGIIISTTVVVGAWRLRKKRTFDLILFVLCIPAFALVPNGTLRYLMPFQPFIWVCLLIVLADLWQRSGRVRIALATFAGAAIIVFAVVEVRMIMLRMAVDARESSRTGRASVGEVALVTGGILGYLRSLPPDTTRLLFEETSADLHTRGTWSAVTPLTSYSLRNSFPGWMEGHRVLAVHICAAPYCGAYARDWATLSEHLCRFGYGLRSVKSWNADGTMGDIKQIVPQAGCSVPVSD